MVYELNQAISEMDEHRAEAQVLAPVLRAARAELGQERANRLILGALRAWGRERYLQIGARLPGSPRKKWHAIAGLGMTRIREQDLEFEWARQDSETVEYCVTRCRYAELFRELGEPELGAVLVCDKDCYLAEVAGPEVEFARTQTLMQGASCCDIRWRVKTNATPG